MSPIFPHPCSLALVSARFSSFLVYPPAFNVLIVRSSSKQCEAALVRYNARAELPSRGQKYDQHTSSISRSMGSLSY